MALAWTTRVALRSFRVVTAADAVHTVAPSRRGREHCKSLARFHPIASVVDQQPRLYRVGRFGSPCESTRRDRRRPRAASTRQQQIEQRRIEQRRGVGSVEAAARDPGHEKHVAWYANEAMSTLTPRVREACHCGTRARYAPITNAPSSAGRHLGRCAEVGQSVGRRAIFPPRLQCSWHCGDGS